MNIDKMTRADLIAMIREIDTMLDISKAWRVGLTKWTKEVLVSAIGDRVRVAETLAHEENDRRDAVTAPNFVVGDHVIFQGRTMEILAATEDDNGAPVYKVLHASGSIGFGFSREWVKVESDSVTDAPVQSKTETVRDITPTLTRKELRQAIKAWNETVRTIRRDGGNSEPFRQMLGFTWADYRAKLKGKRRASSMTRKRNAMAV